MDDLRSAAPPAPAVDRSEVDQRISQRGRLKTAERCPSTTPDPATGRGGTLTDSRRMMLELIKLNRRHVALELMRLRRETLEPRRRRPSGSIQIWLRAEGVAH